MLHKGLFIIAHQIGDLSFYPEYRYLMRNQWKPYDEQKADQEKQLRQLIEFTYQNVPYYHDLFRKLNLGPSDIRTVEDLEKLPVLTKSTIKERWEEFKPVNLASTKYYDWATGGSTGTPMKYRISKSDRFLGGAMLYRGWSYSGFELGDKMVFLAGSSLNVGTKSTLVKRVHEISRNVRKLSSFDMGEEDMRAYVSALREFEPRFITGYSSSIYFFGKWLEANDISVPYPEAIITTADMLFPHMRKSIEHVFGCEVYDSYGLNDGGITAFECPEHDGMHIDTERSIMEVVDGDNHQIASGEGHILATSLNNYAMPFIRYSSGDDGHIVDEDCACKRESKILKKIVGRSTDVLFTPDGKSIHGLFFQHIFWGSSEGVKEFQVVQKTPGKLVIKIVPEDGFNETQEDRIREIVRKRSPNWDIEFQVVDEIQRTAAGKYKFIINEMSHV